MSAEQVRLGDEIGRVAEAMDRGELSREDAVQRLVEVSEGGLTRFGATDLIGRYLAAGRGEALPLRRASL